MKHFIKYLLCAMALLPLLGHAATYVKVPPVANGVNCKPSSINDAGLMVGNCTKVGPSSNLIPWVVDATSTGTPAALPSLATGQGCVTSIVSAANWILGACAQTNGVFTGVVWKGDTPAIAPIVLQPVPGALLRAADVNTAPTAINQRGGVVGVSISANKRTTSVLWAAGNGTPQFIFPPGLLSQSYEDGCKPVDVNFTLVNGYPSVVLNCPDPSTGIFIGKVAKRGATAYAVTSLAVPVGATNCTVSAMNDALNIAGQCFYPDSDTNLTSAVYWANPTSAPQVLITSTGTATKTVNINNIGFILIVREDISGNTSNAVWAPLPIPVQLPIAITLPAGQKWSKATSIRFNGTTTIVALSALNASQQSIGCTWTNAAGVVCIPAIEGGQVSQITSMSPNGHYVAGFVLDNTQTTIAVTATLP